MAVYVSDLLTAIPAPVDVAPASAQTWQWLRSSTAISGATGGTYTTTLADLGTTLAVTQTETNFLGAASATSANTEVVQAYDPNALFRFSEPGVWFDPNDITTLYKGTTGLNPVTAPGDAVSLMLDKSKGGPGPELVANGNFSNPVTTGWVAGGSPPATLSVVLEELNINTAAGVNFPGASYAFTTIVGQSYRVTLTARTNTTNAASVYIRDSGGNYVTNQPSIGTSNTSYDFVFVARQTSSNIYIFEFIGSAGTGTIFADNISVRQLIGNHATQPTLASQPTYGIVPAGGRRNEILYSEQFENANWLRLGISAVTPNAAIAPDGTLTADKVIASATTGEHSIYQNTSSTTGTLYVVAKAAEYDNLRVGDLGNFWFYASFNLTTGVVSGAAGSRLISASAVSLGNGWWGCTIKYTASGVVAVAFGGFPAGATGFAAPNFTGDGTSGVFIWRTQVEPGSLATPYQRVTTQYDVTEAGVPSLGYLQFDGVDDGMITPIITPGTDKVQTFSGVRKNTDNLGVVVELGPIVNTTFGTFFLGTYTGQAFGSSGTTYRDALFTPVANPNTSVLTGLGDISGDRATLRANGVQIAQNTGDQGTGNYNSYVLNIGRRNNSAVAALNGQLFPLIVRFGTNLTAARITATENWMATQTPLQWTVGSGFWNDAYPWSDISAWRD